MQKANTDAADLQLVRELRSAPQRCEPSLLVFDTEPATYTCVRCTNSWRADQLIPTCLKPTSAETPPTSPKIGIDPTTAASGGGNTYQTTRGTAPQRELLAEFMEKFGKKLNEQESRTGDELFMWLKDKLTTETPAPQRELPERLFCKCKNGKPCFDTMFELEQYFSQVYQSGVEAERKRTLSIVNHRHAEWFDELKKHKDYPHTDTGSVEYLDGLVRASTLFYRLLTNQGETK